MDTSGNADTNVGEDSDVRIEPAATHSERAPSVAASSRASNADEAEETPQESSSSRIQFRREYINAEGGVVFSQELQAEDIAKDDPPYAIVVTETFETNQAKGAYRPEDEKGLPPASIAAEATRIEIKSKAVIHALQTIIGYYPEAMLTGDTVYVYEPYELLYHYRQELQQYSDSFSERDNEDEHCQEDPNVAGDIRLLLGFLEQKWGRRVMDELERYKQPKPTCTYDMLWMLFKPGTDVYYDFTASKTYQAHVLHSLNFDYRIGKVPPCYEAVFWCILGDHLAVSPGLLKRHEIFPWSGEKEIAKLNLFPCGYMREDEHGTTNEQRREALVERGKFYFRLLKGPNFVNFDGQDADAPYISRRGRAIVDMRRYEADVGKAPFLTNFETSGQVTSRCHCSHCGDLSAAWAAKRIHFAGYSGIVLSLTNELTDHQYSLCPYYQCAYLLKHRKWKMLKMEGFSWPEFKGNLIDTLVVPRSTRDLLQSLCQKFTSDTTWSADFIEGKGEGSIVLLHGEPGVGKTYTAECVAEHTKKPLISLTTADIGTAPETVESSLLYWFKLAKAWGAILLLDEADVFLERRSATDLVRNNMVAIFLRTLEYYQGILFLTTNRIGTFDEAFLSRIDVPIYFPALTDKQRAKIWGTFFDKLEKERQGKIRVSSQLKYYVEEDRDLLKLSWNGREIRSGFQTAVALAEIEGAGRGDAEITVARNHVAKVVEMAKEFKNYLVELHQKNQADLAASMGLRYDQFQKASREAGESGTDRAV
ncbi:hypothetical protein Q7P37_007093 [Cladosporium fusiforme]